MRKNLEIKVHIQNISGVKKTALAYISAIKDAHRFSESQKDIYYKVSKGRLKLRIINGKPGTLIFYNRKEKAGKRISNYLLASTDNPAELDKILRNLYKILVIVDKKREIYMSNNIRIHIDKVRGLGNYLEFEVIFNSLKEAKKTMAELISLFGLDERMFIKSSYSDLLLKKQLKQNPK